ncbi:MAG: hypothetical protein HYY23_14165 [Verrucomicrobia bacterium]|nr:hypothetical protein [Verrucomicrobiota bacterium]
MAASLSILCLGLTGCFDVGSETQALRAGLVKSAGIELEPEIEIGIGAFTFYLAQAGLRFLDLDEEARIALNTLRSGDVGIYHVRGRTKTSNHSRVLASADKIMSARGWDRVVGVVNRHELVAVYSPQDSLSATDVRLSVVVLQGNKLVIVSARSNVEPLLDLALKQSHLLQKVP